MSDTRIESSDDRSAELELRRLNLRPTRASVLSSLLVGAALAVSACGGDQKRAEGPAEEAGEAADEAAEDAKDAASEGADEASDAAEEAGDKVEDATDE